MATTTPSPNSISVDEKKLQSLRKEQSDLYDLRKTWRRNVSILRCQEAKHGMTPPLHIVNELLHAKEQLSQVDQEIERVEREISELTGRPTGEPLLPAKLVFDFVWRGIQYRINAPYPALGSETVMQPDGRMETIFRFVGGFEARSVVPPGREMLTSFFRHGRGISPIVNNEEASIVLPVDKSIAVNALRALHMNVRRVETVADIPAERIAKGCWTILAPSIAQKTVVASDWPQGYRAYFMTTQMIFEGGRELWTVAEISTKFAQIWFYIGDRNVMPVVDEEHLCLSFPSVDEVPGEE